MVEGRRRSCLAFLCLPYSFKKVVEGDFSLCLSVSQCLCLSVSHSLLINFSFSFFISFIFIISCALAKDPSFFSLHYLQFALFTFLSLLRPHTLPYPLPTPSFVFCLLLPPLPLSSPHPPLIMRSVNETRLFLPASIKLSVSESTL